MFAVQTVRASLQSPDNKRRRFVPATVLGYSDVTQPEMNALQLPAQRAQFLRNGLQIPDSNQQLSSCQAPRTALLITRANVRIKTVTLLLFPTPSPSLYFSLSTSFCILLHSLLLSHQAVRHVAVVSIRNMFWLEISVPGPATLTVDFRGYPQPPWKMQFEYLKLDHDHFLEQALEFTVQQASYRFTL
jgi:hypothetical protein